MVVIGLCEDIDDLFGPIRHNLHLLIFLLRQQETVPFPLDLYLLIQSANILTEFFNDLGVLVPFVLVVYGGHVVVAAGGEQVHELDLLSGGQVEEFVVLDRQEDSLVDCLGFQALEVGAFRPLVGRVLLGGGR